MVAELSSAEGSMHDGAMPQCPSEDRKHSASTYCTITTCQGWPGSGGAKVSQNKVLQTSKQKGPKGNI